MTAEAVMRDGQSLEQTKLVLAASHNAGEVVQLRDGTAGFVNQLKDPSSGDTVTMRKRGIVLVPKTSSIVILDGGRVYWDHSANAAHFRKSNDQDFFLGTAFGEAASADTTMLVDLNAEPRYVLDAARDAFKTVIVDTAGTPTLTRRGGAHEMVLDSTAEAQKVDILTVDSIALAANAIIEGEFTVQDNGSADVGDFFIGGANDTNATDHDSITDTIGLSLNLDDGTVNINAESDDGTTEVAATDTTKDYTVGTKVEFWIDMSDPAACRIFVEGVRVLSGSTFNVAVWANPIKLLAHLEKTANASTAQVDVGFLRARIAEQ